MKVIPDPTGPGQESFSTAAADLNCRAMKTASLWDHACSIG